MRSVVVILVELISNCANFHGDGFPKLAGVSDASFSTLCQVILPQHPRGYRAKRSPGLGHLVQLSRIWPVRDLFQFANRNCESEIIHWPDVRATQGHQ